MSYILTIAGTPVSTLIESLDYASVINGQGTLTFEVPSEDGSYVPALQAEVILTIGGVRVFGGLVDKVEESGLGGEGRVPLKTRVECVSNNIYARRRLITEDVPSGTLKSILQIYEPYFTSYGISLDPSQVAGPTLPARTVDALRGDEALNQLSDETNYVWEIDAFKVLRMFLPGTVAASINIVTGDGHAVGDVVVQRNRANYSNRVTGLFGPADVLDRVESFVGDGVNDTFSIKYLIHGPIPYTPTANVVGYSLVDYNGGTESIGAAGFTPSIWEYDPVAMTIHRTTGVPPLGVLFSLRSQVQFPITIVSEDLVDQGLNGIYETRIKDENVIDYDVGKNILDIELAKGKVVVVTADYRTLTMGLKPGETQTIDVASTRHVNSTFTITEVRINMDAEGVLWARVKAVEGDAFRGSFRDVYVTWAKDSAGGSSFSSANNVVPAGAPGDVQFNAGGALLGADTGRFSYSDTNHELTLDKLTSRDANTLALRGGASSSSVRGDVTVTGGTGVTNAFHGGKVVITGGIASATGATGGAIEIVAGSSSGAGTSQTGGSVTIKTGDAINNNGTITITTGALGTGTPGTLITISIGTPPTNTGGSGVGYVGGSVSIAAGPGQADSFSALGNGTGGAGGQLTLAAGAGGAELTAGNARLAGAGGKVVISAGAGGNAPGAGGGTNTGGAGGDVEITGGVGGTGSAASGAHGKVKIQGLTYPATDGSNGDVLTTNGSGVLSFTAAGSGITQLTGDGTAGPGSGSQAFTLANSGVTPGSYTSASITVDAKGRVTVAASGTGGGGSSIGNITSATAYALPPGFPATGDLWFTTDGFYALRQSGVSWEPWGPLFPMTLPVDGDFAWVNQGTASVSTTKGGIFLQGPKGATKNYRIRKKAAPSTPYSIIAGFLPLVIGSNFQTCGICFRQSSDGKLMAFSLFYNGGFNLYVTSLTDPNTGVSHIVTLPFQSSGLMWLQIRDDGTNRIYSYSRDGQNFQQVYSEGRTTFLTANEVGFFVNDETNLYDPAMTLLSWKEVTAASAAMQESLKIVDTITAVRV